MTEGFVEARVVLQDYNDETQHNLIFGTGAVSISADLKQAAKEALVTEPRAIATGSYAQFAFEIFGRGPQNQD
jgi:hypothetical protein